MVKKLVFCFLYTHENLLGVLLDKALRSGFKDILDILGQPFFFNSVWTVKATDIIESVKELIFSWKKTIKRAGKIGW